MTTKALVLNLQYTVAVCLLVETQPAYLKTHKLKCICHFENLRFTSTSRKVATDVCSLDCLTKYAYLAKKFPLDSQRILHEVKKASVKRESTVAVVYI